MNYNVYKNMEVKINEAEACLSTAQLTINKTTPKALNATEACFGEAREKVKELRPLLATLRRICEANSKQIIQLRKMPHARKFCTVM